MDGCVTDASKRKDLRDLKDNPRSYRGLSFLASKNALRTVVFLNSSLPC